MTTPPKELQHIVTLSRKEHPRAENTKEVLTSQLITNENIEAIRMPENLVSA